MTMQFLPLAMWLGAPVFALSLFIFSFMARRRLGLSWPLVALLVPFWLACSVLLQLVLWQQLGGLLSERTFMLFGFINTPALAASAMLLAPMLLLRRSAGGGGAA